MNEKTGIEAVGLIEELDRRAMEGDLDMADLEPTLIDGLSTRELGEVGELCAISFLSEHGYEILDHHYRCAEGEADIVAYDTMEDEVVMVEVKTRRASRSQRELYPEEAVDRKKRARYRRIAACYCRDRYPVYSLRFDVVGITVKSGCIAEIEHIFNAFDWDTE